MRIAQLANKYEFPRRKIDYYSTLGLIPFTVEDNSNYRDYGEEAETIVKKILILKDIGFSEKKIKQALNDPSYFTTDMWNKHIEKLKEKERETSAHYKEMIQYAEAIRDTDSKSLLYAELFETPKELLRSTLAAKEFVLFFYSADSRRELIEGLPESMNKLRSFLIISSFYFELFDNKMANRVEANSPDVQREATRFFDLVRNYIGLLVYTIYDLLNDDFCMSLLSKRLLSDEFAQAISTEEFHWGLDLFSPCAEWFRQTPDVADASKTDVFLSRFESDIQKINQKLGNDLTEAYTAIIRIICAFPFSIQPKWIDKTFEKSKLYINDSVKKKVVLRLDESLSQKPDYVEHIVNQVLQSEKYICDISKTYITSFNMTHPDQVAEIQRWWNVLLDE